MYELGKVMLDDVEGQGYAFSKKTVFGKTFQGVFFPDNEEDLEVIQAKEELTFQGPVYHRRRDRTARLSEGEELSVTITNTIQTQIGERARFEAVEGDA